ncbi:MAG: hypothetical protein JWM86_1721 [Thermoleophilia bacterium]|nr:hypothetical protein [Thermoleophilia bacterium]
MQHHRHAGLAGRLPAGASTLVPHDDATRRDARMAWFPIATPDGRDVDALEGLLCVPTRAGAMRIVAVPHVVERLALGDEVAVADWDGEPLARGELALALAGTVRAVAADAEHDWRWLARRIDEAAGGAGSCWFDAIGDHAVAASVPRPAIAGVLEQLGADAAAGALRFEYATLDRHDETAGERAQAGHVPPAAN